MSNARWERELRDALTPARLLLLEAEAAADLASLLDERDALADVRATLHAAALEPAEIDVRSRVVHEIDRLHTIANRLRELGIPAARIVDSVRHALAQACDAWLSDTQPIDVEDL